MKWDCLPNNYFTNGTKLSSSSSLSDIDDGFYAPYSSKFEWLDTNNTLQKLVKLEKAFSKLPKPPCFFAGAWGVARELGTVGNYNQGPVRCVLRLSMGESRTDIQLNHPGIQKGRSYGVVLQSRAPLRKEVKH